MRSRIPNTFFISLKPYRGIQSWLVFCVFIAMLGQSLLPTIAYLRSERDPSLWTEICSVYQTKSKSEPVNPGSTSHAECPLCIHVFHDVILDTPGANVVAPHTFYASVIFTVFQVIFLQVSHQLAEARAPPQI